MGGPNSVVLGMTWLLALAWLSTGAAGLVSGNAQAWGHLAPGGQDFSVDVAKVAPIRAAASSQRAQAAALRAEAAATGAEHAATPVSAPLERLGGDTLEDQAVSSLKEATILTIKAKGLLAPVEQRAYAAARAVAEGKVRRMKTEAKKYFDALMAEFNALSTPQADPTDEAIAKATQPYYEAEMKLQAMVESYNQKATETLAEARSLAGEARAMATRATYEQATGETETAQKHMIQAHQTIETAENKRKLAKRVRKLAENVNSAIPAYQQATHMATYHAFETLPSSDV